MLDAPTKTALQIALEKELARRASENRLSDYKPYEKQREFHAKGDEYRERLFMAGNQLGKTLSSAYEIAYHLTGLYPDWWEGKMWDRPVVGWASGVTAESLRDTLQRLVMGRPGEWGTGTIPKARIVDTKRALGVADALDTVFVRHVSGGLSRLSFKAYEKGRAKWQGETLDFVAYDEEPPLDIYVEGITRTNATGGIVWTTFTPLLGMSDVVKRFLDERNPDRVVIRMTINDVDHYTDEERARIIASYPAHERKARASGEPVLGSGAVFPIEEDLIVVDDFAIPDHWAQIVGMDFGWDHPTAAGWLAHDRDKDIVYVTACIKRSQCTPREFAPLIKARGTWIPVAWPHDGLQHEKGSGITLAQQYRDEDLPLLWENAKFEDIPEGLPGGDVSHSRTSVEAGVISMLQMMQTGRWKVFRSCEDWLSEYRRYHRKDGKIVKEYDDAISATRYAYMSLRFAEPLPNPKQITALNPRRHSDWRI